MQKSEFQLNQRLPWLAELTPQPHNVICRQGVLLLKSQFVLGGSLVISAGTTNGTSLGENPGNYALQTLKLQATAANAKYPNGTLRNLSPRTLMRQKIFDHPERRFVADLNNTISGFSGAAGTINFNCPFTVYFELPWLQRPIDSSLDTGFFTQLLYTITQGGRDKQFSGNDRTFTSTGIFWDATHWFQAYTGSGNGPQVVIFHDDRIKNITSANTRLELTNGDFPPDGAVTDVLAIAETTNQALADTIINRVTVKAGGEQFYDAYSAVVKSDMEEYIGDGSTTTSPRTGLYWVPVATDGLLSNAKTNITATIDQSNPGTDRLILSYRRCQNIDPSMRQTANTNTINTPY